MTNIIDRLVGLNSTVAMKAPVDAVAVAAITLSGEQTVNGVAVTDGDRVLVTAQASSVDNGVYDVSTTAWTRSSDFDGNRDLVDGTLVPVRRATGPHRIYQLNCADDPVVIGTSALTFSLAYGPAVSTFTAADATPSVAAGVVFLTDTGALTITDFDDGEAGQEITVISKGAVTFDVTGTNLNGGTVDLVTASGDVTRWVCEDGTVWRLIAFMDASVDNSGGA